VTPATSIRNARFYHALSISPVMITSDPLRIDLPEMGEDEVSRFDLVEVQQVGCSFTWYVAVVREKRLPPRLVAREVELRWIRLNPDSTSSTSPVSKRDIKEAVIAELIAQALPSERVVSWHTDRQNGIMVVHSSSKADADRIAAYMRRLADDAAQPSEDDPYIPGASLLHPFSKCATDDPIVALSRFVRETDWTNDPWWGDVYCSSPGRIKVEGAEYKATFAGEDGDLVVTQARTEMDDTGAHAVEASITVPSAKLSARISHDLVARAIKPLDGIAADDEDELTDAASRMIAASAVGRLAQWMVGAFSARRPEQVETRKPMAIHPPEVE
jgi:hypothetical protein